MPELELEQGAQLVTSLCTRIRTSKVAQFETRSSSNGLKLVVHSGYTDWAVSQCNPSRASVLESELEQGAQLVTSLCAGTRTSKVAQIVTSSSSSTLGLVVHSGYAEIVSAIHSAVPEC